MTSFPPVPLIEPAPTMVGGRVGSAHGSTAAETGPAPTALRESAKIAARAIKRVVRERMVRIYDVASDAQGPLCPSCSL
jgi:hypothetical protein